MDEKIENLDIATGQLETLKPEPKAKPKKIKKDEEVVAAEKTINEYDLRLRAMFKKVRVK